MSRLATTLAVAFSLAASAALAAVHDVTVAPGGAIGFSPQDIEITVGDTVRWTWEGSGHNVRSGVPGAPTGAFFSGAPAGLGTTFEVVFDQAFLDANPVTDNLYDYHCEPHGTAGMVGSVHVLAGTVPVEHTSWSRIKGLYGPAE